MRNTGVEIIDRRHFVLLSGASGLAAMFGGLPAAFAATSEKLATALKKVIGDAKPVAGSAIRLQLPAIAPNGNSVSIKFTVDSPMSDTDHVKAVHIIAESNPVPNIATFRFTPQCGAADIISRIRLARTQNITVVAEMSDGKIHIAQSHIKVTLGGCGA